jgi:hypothetical protein
MNATISAALEAIGVYRSCSGFSTLTARGVRMAEEAAAGPRAGGFAHDPSCLKIGATALLRYALLLVIDIGGSHTKAGVVRRSAEGRQAWEMLFDRDNNEIDSGPANGLPIERFTAALAALIRTGLERIGCCPGEVEAAGVIWSNALESARFNLARDGVYGVTGLISGSGTGKSYRKGEFFVAGLKDGYDIGALLLRQLRGAGLSPRVLLIGNDTIFTLKATPGADGGMVASTGANATDVDREGFIYNTEMGGLFEIDPDFLSEGDKLLLAERPSTEAVKLEDMIAGRWLPRVLELHVTALAAHGIEVFAPLAAQFSSQRPFFTGKDLSALLSGEPPLEQRLMAAGVHSALLPLRETAAALVARAGRLAGLMAYLCLRHPLSWKHSAILSLDSSQARHVPGYLDAMRASLDALTAPHQRAEVVLQKPDGQIAVPMKGLVEALADELALAL